MSGDYENAIEADAITVPDDLDSDAIQQAYPIPEVAVNLAIPVTGKAPRPALPDPRPARARPGAPDPGSPWPSPHPVFAGVARERYLPKALIDDLPLFSATPSQPAPAPRNSELEDKMAEILPDELTPREALQILYDLKELTRGR